MKALLDRSVLVPVFLGDHEHHKSSLDLFLRYKKRDVSCAAHGMAEVYATLTRLPGKHRLSPAQSMLCVGEIRQRLSVVALTELEYYSALERASSLSIVGGTTYDALIVACALKAKADTIYTWNLRHFEQLDLPGRIETP